MWRGGRIVSVVLAGILAIATDAMADEQHDDRLRVEDHILQAAIDAASQESSAFRALLSDLQTSTTIVYVRSGRCPHGFRSCLQFLAGTATQLYVVAMVDPLIKQEAKIAGLIAHELQHVRELRGVDIRDAFAFERFFADHARHEYGGYETDAAVAIGSIVERQVSSARRRR